VAVKKMADEKHGTTECGMYRDFRELLDRKDIDAVLIATGPNWHAQAAVEAARAGKDIYCEKPCSKNIAQTLILRDTIRRAGRVFQAGTQRRNLPHFAFACELARTGRLGKLTRVYAHPAGMKSEMSGWLPAETPPDPAVVDWNMYLGPAAWRPYNAKLLDGFNFEKGGGLVGGGVLEWGSHCVDLCQWAMGDCPPPVEYNPPKDGELVARYGDGAELVFREKGWIPLGSCPVRFEGETGWVETGDSGKLVLSSPTLLAGRSVEEIGGYPATFHVRDFLDCVKTRGQPRGNVDAACNAHLACHAANVALHLGRTVRFDTTARPTGCGRRRSASRGGCEPAAPDRAAPRGGTPIIHFSEKVHDAPCPSEAHDGDDPPPHDSAAGDAPETLSASGRRGDHRGRDTRGHPRRRGRRPLAAGKGTDRRPAVGRGRGRQGKRLQGARGARLGRRRARPREAARQRTAGLVGADRAGGHPRPGL
jgi:predicted dehydrogenase